MAIFDFLNFKRTHVDFSDAYQALITVRSFEADETMIWQHEPDDSLYCLVSGSAKVVKNSIGGHEIWLAELPPGAIFGEMAPLIGARRTSNVIAMTRTQTEVLSSKDLDALMHDFPQFPIFIARMLAARIEQTSRMIFERLSLPATRRIYADLVRMGEVDPDNAELFVITPALSVTDMASRWNLSRESASRSISQLQNQGLLKKVDDSWHVIEPDFEGREE